VPLHDGPEGTVEVRACLVAWLVRAIRASRSPSDTLPSWIWPMNRDAVPWGHPGRTIYVDPDELYLLLVEAAGATAGSATRRDQFTVVQRRVRDALAWEPLTSFSISHLSPWPEASR
jgi:hypothetical protein